MEAAYEEFALPDFERDFVWTREEVADLVRSIVGGYFIGSLLLLRCDASSAVRSRLPQGVGAAET